MAFKGKDAAVVCAARNASRNVPIPGPGTEADTVRNRICPNAKELVLMIIESMQMNSLQAILAGRQIIAPSHVNHPLFILAMPKLARPFNDILQDCFVLNLIFSVGLHLGSNAV